ncbi:MAG TPA: hypothetical protein VFM54_06530 [Micromonosporaceae bacterium]|nr:hypothetical protein [Micromonosporaceae bacterium]
MSQPPYGDGTQPPAEPGQPGGHGQAGQPGQPTQPGPGTPPGEAGAGSYPPAVDPFGPTQPTSPGGYPQQPGYPAYPGYPQQPGYPTPPGYQQPGYPPGYPQQPTSGGGYPTQPVSGGGAWPGQAQPYPPTSAYPAAPGYPQGPGYPAAPGYDPNFPQPGAPGGPPRRRRRGLLITLIVLGLAVLLCGGGGTAAFLLLREADGQGSGNPTEAVTGFLRAVYTDRDVDKASTFVCSEARDKNDLTKKINEIGDYAKQYKNPKFSWGTPTVSDEDGGKATVDVKVKITTEDEKVAEQALTFTVVKKTGWFVCEVRST